LEHPIQELRGFKRVSIQPGEQKTIEFPLTAKSLACWDDTRHAWTIGRGSVEVRIGGSSADIRLKTTVTVE
jgi:beta-glucosidase